MRKTSVVVAAFGCAAVVTRVQATDAVFNGNFANPSGIVDASSGPTQSPVPSGYNAWDFQADNGDSGIAAPDSTSYAHTDSSHGQVGYLLNTASISQKLHLAAGSYTFSFQTEQTSSQSFEQVTASLTDAGNANVVTPQVYSPGVAWAIESFPVTIVTAGDYTLDFSTFGSGVLDHAAVIDNVSAPVPAPEPASLGLAAMASLGLLRRRR